MDTITPPLIRTFPNLERYEPVNIDSSALSNFKKCPYSYYLRYVLGFTSKETKIYFSFGTAYHRYREVLEKSWKEFNGLSHKSYEEHIATGIEAGLKSWGSTRDLIPPSKFYWLTKARLIESMMMVGKHWIEEKKNNKIVVLETEQPFNIVLPDGNTRSGRFDQIILLNGKSIWGRDFKTTTKEMMFFESMLSPNDQFIGYTYAQQKLTGKPVSGQMVEVLQSLRPTKDNPKPSKLEFRNVSYSPGQFELWEREQAYWQVLLKACRDNDFYPRNETQCGFCEFHNVCKLPTEAQQLLMLKSQYKIEVWDNTYDEG